MPTNSLLKATPGLYRGLVTGLESGACSARIEVRSAPGGCLTVDYEAASERHGLQLDGDLTWSWHWAEEGAEPRVMSRAVCRLTEF